MPEPLARQSPQGRWRITSCILWCLDFRMCWCLDPCMFVFVGITGIKHVRNHFKSKWYLWFIDNSWSNWFEILQFPKRICKMQWHNGLGHPERERGAFPLSRMRAWHAFEASHVYPPAPCGPPGCWGAVFLECVYVTCDYLIRHRPWGDWRAKGSGMDSSSLDGSGSGLDWLVALRGS